MATIDVEARVPVREGVYGDRVAMVEPGGVELIPEGDRHGRPLDLFWTWMSPNLEFATVFVGVIPVAFFGGGFWATVIALVLGTGLGSLTHGVLSSWGPKFGVPQMVQARGAFGFLGNVLPAGLNAFTAGIGWFIVNSVSGAFALQALFGWHFWVGYVLVVVAQVGVAFLGHNLVHVFERAVFPYLAIVFALATGVILWKTHYSAGFNPHNSPGGGSSAAFILAFFIAYGYAVGWNPYASDYSRYLSPRTNRRRVGLAAGLDPGSDQHLCLKRAGSGWALAPAQVTPGTATSVEFRSPIPDFGISCSMAEASVVCQSGLPQHRVSMGLDGQLKSCSNGTSATNACHIGIPPAGTPTLAYGNQVTVGPFRCRSEQAGVMCIVIKSGKGFLFNNNGASPVGP
jgi:Permease for cytosine/purines, uracil, thiamine, allantoin